MFQHHALPAVVCLTCALLTMTSIGSVAPTGKCYLLSNIDAEAYYCHRSHFGSRYTLGCCACAVLFTRVQSLLHVFPQRKQETDRTAENNISVLVEVFCLEGLTPIPPFTNSMDSGGFYSSISLILRD